MRNIQYQSIYENPNINYYSHNPELDSRVVPHCVPLLAKYVKGKILDVGAGKGDVTDLLCKSKLNVLCCDISKKNLIVLKNKGYTTKLLNLDNYPYNIREGFNTILSTDVIEHLLSPYLHLVECFRLLKEGGQLILITPQANKCEVTTPHIMYFSPRSLELLFKRIGFVNIKRIYNGVFSPILTKITNHIPFIRNMVNVGCYYVVQKPFSNNIDDRL